MQNTIFCGKRNYFTNKNRLRFHCCAFIVGGSWSTKRRFGRAGPATCTRPPIEPLPPKGGPEIPRSWESPGLLLSKRTLKCRFVCKRSFTAWGPPDKKLKFLSPLPHAPSPSNRLPYLDGRRIGLGPVANPPAQPCCAGRPERSVHDLPLKHGNA